MNVKTQSSPGTCLLAHCYTRLEKRLNMKLMIYSPFKHPLSWIYSFTKISSNSPDQTGRRRPRGPLLLLHSTSVSKNACSLDRPAEIQSKQGSYIIRELHVRHCACTKSAAMMAINRLKRCCLPCCAAVQALGCAAPVSPCCWGRRALETDAALTLQGARAALGCPGDGLGALAVL